MDLNRRQFMMAALAVSALGASEALGAKEFGRLIGRVKGFSATQIKTHLAYLQLQEEKLAEVKGYLNEVDLSTTSPFYSDYRALIRAYTELTTSIYWHRLYFEGLSLGYERPRSGLSEAIAKAFGSFDRWKIRFYSLCQAARAWAVVAADATGQLYHFCLDSESEGLCPEYQPIIVVDTADHAYLFDFGNDRAGYAEAIIKALAWSKLEERFQKVKGGKSS